MSMVSKKKVTKKVVKKKVVKKKVTKKEEESPTGDFFSDLVEAAKDQIEDIFVPDEVVGNLVEVSDWIPMPDPVCEALGDLPGLPCGHIVEVLGKPDSGKTTLCIHALIGVQQSGGIAILLDSEHKFNMDRAVAMGLDKNRLIIIPADTVEEVFDKFVDMLKLIKSKEEWKDRKVVVAWDSVGATPCENELNEKTKDHNMKTAQAIKAGLRKTRYFLRKTNASLLLINQVYTKQTSSPWEKKTTGCGGSGPEYFSSIRLECSYLAKIRRKKQETTINSKGKKVKKETTLILGIESQIECIKNHMAIPFRKVKVEIDRKGIVVDRKPEL